jgi:DnaJ-class molecular chaperone
MDQRNHYQVLQVDRRASKEVIKAAYRSLSFICPNEKEQLALNLANQCLMDEVERSKYDSSLSLKNGTIGNYKVLREIAEGGF